MIRLARHGRSSSWPSWPNTCVPHYAISLTGRKGPYMRTRGDEGRPRTSGRGRLKPPHPEERGDSRASKERRFLQRSLNGPGGAKHREGVVIEESTDDCPRER